MTIQEPQQQSLPVRTKVFISYSHVHKKKWLQRLKMYLEPLGQENIIDVWDDTQIGVGAKWREEIEKALATTKIAILLVSAEFVNSKFIRENELPPLLEAARNDGLIIIPVIVNPCRLEYMNLGELQALNPPSRSLLTMREIQWRELFLNLSYSIEKTIKSN